MSPATVIDRIRRAIGTLVSTATVGTPIPGPTNIADGSTPADPSNRRLPLVVWGDVFPSGDRPQVRRALAGADETPAPALSWARRDLGLRRAHPPTAGGGLRSAVRAGLSSIVGSIFGAAVAPREATVPLILLGLGPVRLAGIPADFGVGATLHIRGAMTGGELAVVSSHSNGFVGYVHLPDDYAWSPAVNAEMFHYENAMGWYGRDAGQKIADAVVNLSGALGSTREGSR